MRHHVSYNKDAVIENPLHFILLIKLLIVFFFHFYFCAPNLSTLSTSRHKSNCRTLSENIHKNIITKPVTKHFAAFLGDPL